MLAPMRGTGDAAGPWPALEGRGNALNTLRLFLAALVIIGHSPGMASGRTGTPYLGAFAVDCFFAISGYLVTGSRMRLSMSQYLLRRGRRILPGFWVCLAITAFVFAPVSTLFSGSSYDVADAVRYVWSNAGLVITHPAIDDTLGVSQTGTTWNAPLWTLSYEFAAYVLAGLLSSLRRLRLAAAVLALGVCAAGSLLLGTDGWQLGGADPEWTRLGAFFAAGVLLRRGWPRGQFTPDMSDCAATPNQTSSRTRRDVRPRATRGRSPGDPHRQ